MIGDGLKKCPRCKGKRWVYYKSFKCPLCKGSGRCRRDIFLCQGFSRTHVRLGISPRYRIVVRQCRRPATSIHRGKHYCWQHSPADGYARRRAWEDRNLGKPKPQPAAKTAQARWERQQAAIRAALRKASN